MGKEDVMRTDDFGPVPVSQMKTESRRMFDALDAGRRVLISRHGQVVAVIDPPHLAHDEHALALFALAEPSDLHELSATIISQRSPAAFVRAAEEGVSCYVTRDHKVHGVLRRHEANDDSDQGLTIDAVIQREHALSQFEQEHPDATAEEFAAAVASWSPQEPTAAQLATPSPVAAQREPQAGDVGRGEGHDISDDAVETLADALLVKARALVAAGRATNYPDAMADLTDAQMRRLPGSVRRRLVRRSLVALGRSYAETDPDRAVALADAAIDSISAEDAPESLADAYSASEPTDAEVAVMG